MGRKSSKRSPTTFTDRLFILFALISSLACVDVRELHAEQLRKFRCALIAPLTGAISQVGRSIKNGAILADSDYDQDNQIDWVFEDDQFLPKNSISIFHKLIQRGDIDCIVIFGSTTALSVAGLAEKAKIPLIGIAITPHLVAGRSYVFRFHMPIVRQAGLLIQEVKKRGYKSIAAVTSHQDATLALRDYVLESGIKLSPDQQYQFEENDFQGVVSRIRLEKPDAVFLNLLPPQTTTFARQLRASGYQGDLFGGPTLGNPDAATAARGAMEGAWLVNVDDTRAGDFYIRYLKQFGEEAAPEGLYGYDVAKLLYDGRNSLDLTQYLSSIKNFSGIIGTYGAERNVFDIPAKLWKIEGGKFKALHETSSESLP